MTRWRQRMAEDRLVALLQESLAAATRTGAAKPADFTRVIVDTTVQPKAIAHPTDAKLLFRAREHLVRHAKQFKRANRALAARVHAQQPKQRGQKIFSLHAPEVECIGKGKAHRPYEFGVKVSVATPIQRCRGGQFVAHVAALPGNPYDGHTLAKVVPDITRQIGVSLQRVIADAGYRGHNAPKGRGLSVFTSGQKRGVTDKIKRELRRRSAVEPVIGHLKSGHRMDRNHLFANAQNGAVQ